MGMRIGKEQSGTFFLINVLWGRTVTGGTTLCPERLPCTNTLSGLASRAVLESCSDDRERGMLIYASR